MDGEPVEILLRFNAVVKDERGAPELLPFQHELIDQVDRLLKAQEQTIGALSTQGEDPLECDLLQMEVQRYKFLLKDYYRCVECVLSFVGKKSNLTNPPQNPVPPSDSDTRNADAGFESSRRTFSSIWMR